MSEAEEYLKKQGINDNPIIVNHGKNIIGLAWLLEKFSEQQNRELISACNQIINELGYFDNELIGEDAHNAIKKLKSIILNQRQ